MPTISHDSETPAHGQQVITAVAFIHQDFDDVTKVFLPKRASDKKYLPDVYELPGGHINFGEEIVDGLKREIMEEHQMHISVGDPFYVYTYHNNVKGSHSIEVVYFAQFTDPIENIQINPGDHSEFGWFEEKELNLIMKINRIDNDPEIEAVKKGFSLLKGNGVKVS